MRVQKCCCFFFFISSPLSHLLPASVFSEEWSAGAGGGSVYVCVCVLVGRAGVRAALKRKCVIVTELRRKSRGGQCADRTLGCMIHGRGPNMNPLEPSSPSLSFLRFWRPQRRLYMSEITPERRFAARSPHVTPCVGDAIHLVLIAGRNLRTTSKQTNITSGFFTFLICSERRHNITAVTAELTMVVFLFFQTGTPNWTLMHFGTSQNESKVLWKVTERTFGFLR